MAGAIRGGLLHEMLTLVSLQEAPSTSCIPYATPPRIKSPPSSSLVVNANRILPIGSIRAATPSRSRVIKVNNAMPLARADAQTMPSMSQHSAPLPPQTSRSSNANSQLVQQQKLFTQQALRFLHVTEYVVLVEFVEVIISAIYCKRYAMVAMNTVWGLVLTRCAHCSCMGAALYLSVAVHLPNRQFYPQLVDLDSSRHQRLVANVVVYATLGLSTLLRSTPSCGGDCASRCSRNSRSCWIPSGAPSKPSSCSGSSTWCRARWSTIVRP